MASKNKNNNTQNDTNNTPVENQETEEKATNETENFVDAKESEVPSNEPVQNDEPSKDKEEEQSVAVSKKDTDTVTPVAEDNVKEASPAVPEESDAQKAVKNGIPDTDNVPDDVEVKEESDPIPESDGRFYVSIGFTKDDNHLMAVEERVYKAGEKFTVTASGEIIVGPYKTYEDAIEGRRNITRKGLKGKIVKF